MFFRDKKTINVNFEEKIDQKNQNKCSKFELQIITILCKKLLIIISERTSPFKSITRTIKAFSKIFSFRTKTVFCTKTVLVRNPFWYENRRTHRGQPPGIFRGSESNILNIT